MHSDDTPSGDTPPEATPDGPSDRARDGGARAAAVLGTAMLCAIVALVALQRLTAERAAAADAARREASLAAVLPDGVSGVGPARVLDGRRFHRVDRDGHLAAVAIDAVAPDGYNGPIELVVGVRPDGRVGGVRVGAHRETPGLGDRIERRRSDWIEGFDGRALGTGDWRVTRGGANGSIDALSGATITSRAVTDAVRDALAWFETHRDTLLGLPEAHPAPGAPR